ncbi:hypothetical protein M3O96_19245 [Aquiflexum sp. TKW24L]|uniref:hypothetical protein n=1 Tax=Aquiflexum sp. TKW24L TaxID=2942212 RepID=UPI0020C0761F|nr:hypothetical protein [Aquiflexum sp. TKW24L]MCL6261246.1 hypothetical protein [Aquiflexum sp. TKW24L]
MGNPDPSSTSKTIQTKHLAPKQVLFVTWDSPHVNYLENLFIPIFQELKERFGIQFHIVQFMWGANELIQQRRKKFLELGIPYQAFRTSQKYPLTSLLKAVFFDTLRIKKYIKKHGIEIIMPRAVTSLAIVHGLVKNPNLKLIFDADGFPLDERVDFSGLSPLSLRYRYFRDIEFKGYQLADSIICRSEKAKLIIASRAGAKFNDKKVFVVNNGTFKPSKLQAFTTDSNAERCQFVYLGSSGPQYMLGEMLQIFGMVKEEIGFASFRILTFQVDQVKEFIQEKFPTLYSVVEVRTVSPDEVMGELENADFGISFRTPSFSVQGVAPIKISEYLSAGLNVIYNSGTGDVETLLEGKDFAFCIHDFSPTHHPELIQWVKMKLGKNQRKEVRDFAASNFSLERISLTYQKVIQYASGIK